MNPNINQCALAVCVFAYVALAPASHANNTCDALYQAGIKSVQTPHHVYSTTTLRDGRPQTGEAVYAGGVEYLLFHGKWMRSPMSQQAMLEGAQDKLKTHPDICTLVGKQTVDGQLVSVYEVHNNEAGTDQMVRILDASGLMQGSTLTLPNHSVVETRYDYANVQAPTGVQ